MEDIKKEKKEYRPLVYICSPYRGNVENNVARAKEFCRFALDQGQIPLAPHLMFPQFMDDSINEERELALFMDIILMGKCDEVWVLLDRISSGMQAEIDKAHQRKQPVRYFDSSFKEVYLS